MLCTLNLHSDAYQSFLTKTEKNKKRFLRKGDVLQRQGISG